MMWLFPQVPPHKCADQFAKVREELEEVEHAHDEDNLIEEYWDTMHALEQLGRKIAEQVGGDRFWSGRDVVLTKNYGRGLYAQN